MKAAVLAAPGEITIVQVAVPEPGEGEVRIRVEGCGVCASNLEPGAGLPWIDYPGEAGGLGHEGWGTIDALGQGVDALAVGERVAALSYRSFAKYDVAPASMVVKLPPELAGQPFPGEPLGCAFNIFRRSVIATPSAQHAEQAIAALERGVAVFCQKPLGRNEAEVRAAIAAAEKADRLLGVDLSYRQTAATRAIARLLGEGALGKVFAVDLTFHNAYGPDKPWFYKRGESGGGCVIDLGVHLVDLALFLLGCPQVERVSSRLYSQGRRLEPGSPAVEDYATAVIDLATGASIRLACSWNLHAGRDAVIGAQFYGTEGAAGFHNLDGSFFDFAATISRGTTREQLTAPPDDWGGRVAAAWVCKLAENRGFDPSAAQLGLVAQVLDRIYAGR